MTGPEELASPDIMRRLAEWLEKNGLEEAFISMALVLLFIYFLKLIFKPSVNDLLQEIKNLLIEIKAYLTKNK